MATQLSRKRRSPSNKLSELLWEPDDAYELTPLDISRGWFEHQLIHPRINYKLLVRCKVNAGEYAHTDMIVDETTGIVHVTLGGWETVDEYVRFQYYYRHGGRLVPAPDPVLLDLESVEVFWTAGVYPSSGSIGSYIFTIVSADPGGGAALTNTDLIAYRDSVAADAPGAYMSRTFDITADDLANTGITMNELRDRLAGVGSPAGLRAMRFETAGGGHSPPSNETIRIYEAMLTLTFAGGFALQLHPGDVYTDPGSLQAGGANIWSDIGATYAEIYYSGGIDGGAYGWLDPLERPVG